MSKNRTDLRPVLELSLLENSTPEENFQNQTLRPVLKLQNDLYMSLFSQYATKQKPDYESLSSSKKKIFLEQSLQKDLVLKNTMIGMTVGMFTLEELEVYNAQVKLYNKRIITMLVERLKNGIN